MLRVEDEAFKAQHEQFFAAAAEQARLGTCQNDRCGSVLVSASGVILAVGHNGPAGDDEAMRMCDKTAGLAHERKPKSDITCCMHAEDRTVRHALQQGVSSEELADSTLYFMRVDFETGELRDSGDPYCTLCSRSVLDAGIGQFALYSAGGARIYPTTEYNLLSYQFHEQ